MSLKRCSSSPCASPLASSPSSPSSSEAVMKTRIDDGSFAHRCYRATVTNITFWYPVRPSKKTSNMVAYKRTRRKCNCNDYSSDGHSGGWPIHSTTTFSSSPCSYFAYFPMPICLTVIMVMMIMLVVFGGEMVLCSSPSSTATTPTGLMIDFSTTSTMFNQNANRSNIGLVGTTTAKAIIDNYNTTASTMETLRSTTTSARFINLFLRSGASSSSSSVTPATIATTGRIYSNVVTASSVMAALPQPPSPSSSSTLINQTTVSPTTTTTNCSSNSSCSRREYKSNYNSTTTTATKRRELSKFSTDYQLLNVTTSSTTPSTKWILLSSAPAPVTATHLNLRDDTALMMMMQADQPLTSVAGQTNVTTSAVVDPNVYQYYSQRHDNDLKVLLSRYPSLRLPPPPPEYADDFEAGITEMDTVAGTRVEIPCNTSSWSDEEVSLVLWFRGDTGVPIYRVDARNSTLAAAVHTTSDDLRHRLHFDIKTRPPVLRINPVHASDAAEYRCRVDYRQSRTQNVIVLLNVTVPPKELLIMDVEGQKLEGFIGPFDESSSVLLICEAEGGKPSPWVHWYHGNRLFDSSYTVGPHSLVRNELNLRQLNRSDFMSLLVCRASNNNVTEPISATVVLDMNLRPLDVKILTRLHKTSPNTGSGGVKSPQAVILSAGSKAEFQCQSTGSRPAAQISWWLGAERLSVNVRDSVNEDGNATISTITFVPGLEDHGKLLTCRADNLPMPHTALKDERLLNVQFSPQLRISFGANIQTDSIREGSDVYLECQVRANPPVKEVVWLHDGRPINAQLATSGSLDGSRATGSTVIMTNQSLVIQRVHRSHRGRYQCVAFNEQGETVSEPLTLKVNFAPVCKTEQKMQYGVSRNEQIRIRCEVEAEPANSLTFHWTLTTSGGESSTEWVAFTTNASTSIATYRPESSLDYGTMACFAQNAIGSQMEPCVYSVVPAGRPDPLRGCVITNHSMTTLLVDCAPGDDGGLKQHFNLEVYTLPSHSASSSSSSSSMPEQRLHSNHSSSQATFIVSSLSPGTQYTLLLYATNAKGRSHTVSLSAVTLAAPEKHVARGSFEQIVVHPILGILIGIVATIVLVIIALILLIRSRLRPRRPCSRNGTLDSTSSASPFSPTATDCNGDIVKLKKLSNGKLSSSSPTVQINNKTKTNNNNNNATNNHHQHSNSLTKKKGSKLTTASETNQTVESSSSSSNNDGGDQKVLGGGTGTNTSPSGTLTRRRIMDNESGIDPPPPPTGAQTCALSDLVTHSELSNCDSSIANSSSNPSSHSTYDCGSRYEVKASSPAHYQHGSLVMSTGHHHHHHQHNQHNQHNQNQRQQGQLGGGRVALTSGHLSVDLSSTGSTQCSSSTSSSPHLPQYPSAQTGQYHHPYLPSTATLPRHYDSTMHGSLYTTTAMYATGNQSPLKIATGLYGTQDTILHTPLYADPVTGSDLSQYGPTVYVPSMDQHQHQQAYVSEQASILYYNPVDHIPPPPSKVQCTSSSSSLAASKRCSVSLLQEPIGSDSQHQQQQQQQPIYVQLTKGGKNSSHSSSNSNSNAEKNFTSLATTNKHQHNSRTSGGCEAMPETFSSLLALGAAPLPGLLGAPNERQQQTDLSDRTNHCDPTTLLQQQQQQQCHLNPVSNDLCLALSSSPSKLRTSTAV